MSPTPICLPLASVMVAEPVAGVRSTVFFCWPFQVFVNVLTWPVSLSWSISTAKRPAAPSTASTLTT